MNNDFKLSNSSIGLNFALLKSLADFISYPILIIDSNFKFIGGNSAYDNILSKYHEPEKKKEFYQRIIEEVKKAVKDIDIKISKTQDIKHYSYNFIFPDRSVHDLMLHIVNLPATDTSSNFILVTISNIYNQKETEEALRLSEEKYSILLSHLPVAIYRTTPDGKIVEGNATLAEYLGYKGISDLTDVNVSDLYVKQADRQKHLKKLNLNHTSPAEYELKRDDGKIIWVRDYPRAVPSADGGIEYYDGILVDITREKLADEELLKYQQQLEEKVFSRTEELTQANLQLQQEIVERERAEKALRESEQRFRNITERSFDAIYEVDGRGVVTYVSPAIKNILGYSQDEIKGYPFIKIMSEKHHKRASKGLELLKRGKVLKSLQLVLSSKNGSPAYVELSALPIFRDDKFLGSYGNLRNITDRKKTEVSLMRQVKEMTVLHAAAIANAESATIDELIDRVTTIVGNAIYPTHFGILVVDENIGVIHTHSSYRFRDSYKDLTLKIGEGITGTVALTGKPIRMSDVRNEPIYVETDPMIRSELCVPVKIGKKVIAVINTEHEGVDAFTENDERLLLTIAGQMATAMARLRAEESLFKQVKELSVLHSVAIACVEEKSQDELIERITQIIGETLFSTNFGMMLIDEEEGLLKTHHSYRLWEGQEPMILELGHGITGWVAQHGKVLRVPDVTKEPLYVEGDIRTLSELAVPLKVGDKVIGTINTEHNKLNAYSEMDEKLLATFAGQLAPALERLRAEEALKEERDMAQNYLDIAGAILVAIDRDGKITLINKRGSDILGYRDIELIGKDWFDISLSEEEREKQRLSFRKKISGKKQPEEYYETNLKTRTGDKRIIVWRDSILRDDSGHIIGTLSSGEDITERKDLEQKLRVSEEEYRTLVENLNIGVYRNTADEKGRFLKANPAIVRIFGYNSIEDFLKTSVRDMYQKSGDRDDFIAELKSKGSITSRELKLKKKNGSPIIASVTATIQHNPNGEIKWIDGVIEDITEQKRAEDELLAEKERLAVTLRSIGEGVITVDIEGRIVLLNKVAEDLTGWKHTEAVGRKLEDVFCIEGEVKDELMPDPFSKVISSGIAISFPENTTLISKKGAKRIIAYNGAPIMDQNSEIIGVVLVFRDITEKMIIEEELQKAQKLESIGILAGGIAHDFNNILAAILGNLSLANLQINPKSKAYIHLMEAEKAVERARNLTTQLLTFSKGGAPIRETASIADLLIETVKFSLVGSNVESRFSFQDDLLSAKIDKGQISQVINNLVLNASQAMPDGGVIEVNASNIRSGSSEDTLSLEPGDFIKISIRDYGCGIPEEYLNKIFDPYYTTKETGSGLGLTTAYSIIHKHKGHISVESIVGMGTIFHVYLPASGEKLTKKRKPKINDLKGKGRILFMDDEIGIRNTIEDVIKHLGYSVKMTSDGEEMIKLYRDSYNSGEPFDAVIMDLTVPGGLGGKDAINNLKEIDPNVKAIASSGYSNDPVMAQYEKFGFKGILVKPFNIHDVGNVLKKVLSE